jgi:hypothetical protein
MAAFSHMANTIGRLKQGDLLIEGEVLERTPPVKNGLVTNFPFDSTEIGINYTNNILDDSTWVPGLTGTVGMFGSNGDGNQIITFSNPWGEPSPTWATLGNDSASDADGGWNVQNLAVDSTKKYRLSVWIRRENAGNGRTYFGCQANTVANLSDGATNGNPYFYSPVTTDAPEIVDNWTLWIAYIQPSTYSGGSDPTNGIYKLDGTRTRGMTDYKWVSGITYGGHRTYLYYSTSTTERHYWFRPRMEICDGSEPTIQELIIGMNNAVHPTANTNNTVLPDGIAVEESTTNLYYSAGQPAPASNAGGTAAEINSYSVGAPIPTAKTWLLTKTGSGNQWNGWESAYGTTFGSLAVGDYITVSGYYKSSTDVTVPNFSLAFYTTDWASAVSTTATAPIVYDGDWHYFSMTVKITTAYTNPIIADGPSWNYSTKAGTMLINGLQWEKKAGPTAYVNGSRSANGDLQLPLNLGSDWTIFYRFTPRVDWGDYYTTSYNRYMFYLYDKNSTKKIWLSDYHGAATQTYSIPWIGFDEYISTGTTHWHAINVDMQANKECWFALTKSGNTWTKWLYSANGLATDSISQTDAGIAALSPSKIDFVGDFCARIRDFAAYNRALSQSEILKIATNGFSITKNGDTKSITKEKPNSIPVGTFYFPLGIEGSDTTKTCIPSSETNKANQDGATWIGSSATNLYTGEYGLAGSSYGTQVKDTDGWFKVTATAASYGVRYYVTLTSLVNGTTYTGSATVYNPTSSAVTVEIDWCDAGAQNITIQPFETKIISSTASKATYDSTYRFLDVGPAVGGTIWIKDIQIEATPFPTPYVGAVGSSRAITHLEYNQSILNVAQGCIMGWWKFSEAARAWRGPGNNNDYSMLFATYGASEANKLNIRSYYSDAANTWTAHVSNSSASNNTIAFTVTDGWHFVALSWSNAGKMKVNVDGKLIQEKTGIGTPASFDSPLRIGQWDGGNWGAMNQYVRDLIITNTYPTDAQILDIYKNQMRAYKNGSLIIQGQIREGKVL